MSTTALLIIVVSTFFHAGWNLLIKHSRSGSRFARRMLIGQCVIGAVPVLLVEWLVGPLFVHVWGFVLLSGGVCCALYLLGLSRAYGAADFTTVYPVARALPVLFVAAAELPLGRVPSVAGWLGLLLVVAGCLLAPMTTLRGLRPGVYLNRAMIWILLTATGTVGYSLIDNLGAGRMAELGLTGLVPALGYTYYYLSASLVGFLVLESVFRRQETDDTAVGWLRPATAGIMCLVGYGLIIYAFQITEQTSYVVAGRQLSVVIGVVLAFFVFGEPGRAIRFTAAVLIAGGVIVIRLWG